MNENYEINTDELYEGNCRKAEKMLKDPGKIDKMIKRLERKLEGLPKLGDTLAYIPKMAMLISSWIKHEYTEIPVGIISAILGALIYFVSPIDAIPDIIPGIGLLDDAAVVSGLLYLVKNDIDEYMTWRVQTGLDETVLSPDEYTIYME